MGDGFFLVVGICVSSIGLILISCILVRIFKCRYKVAGTVKKLSKESFMLRGSTVYRYRPVLQYEVEGKKYEVKASFRSRKQKYNEGDIVTFKVCKKDPTDVVFKNIYSTLLLSLLFASFGALLVILYFI